MLLLRSAKDFLVSLIDAFRKCVNNGIDSFFSLLGTLSQIVKNKIDPEIGAMRYSEQPLLKMVFDIVSELFLFC